MLKYLFGEDSKTIALNERYSELKNAIDKEMDICYVYFDSGFLEHDYLSSYSISECWKYYDEEYKQHELIDTSKFKHCYLFNKSTPRDFEDIDVYILNDKNINSSVCPSLRCLNQCLAILNETLSNIGINRKNNNLDNCTFKDALDTIELIYKNIKHLKNLKIEHFKKNCNHNNLSDEEKSLMEEEHYFNYEHGETDIIDLKFAQMRLMNENSRLMNENFKDGICKKTTARGKEINENIKFCKYYQKKIDRIKKFENRVRAVKDVEAVEFVEADNLPIAEVIGKC